MPSSPWPMAAEHLTPSNLINRKHGPFYCGPCFPVSGEALSHSDSTSNFSLPENDPSCGHCTKTDVPISPELDFFLNSGEIAVVGLVSPRLLHRLICLDFFFHNRRRILRRLSFIRFSLKDDIQGKPLLNNQQAKTQ